MDDELLLPPTTVPRLSVRDAAARGENALLALFGGSEWFPSSVMTIKRKRPDAEADEQAELRSYRESCRYKDAATDPDVPHELRKMMTTSSKGSLEGALSQFPQEVGRAVVLFYTEPGQLVVDPFAGHNSRMDLVVKAGRHYVGCDLSTEFMAFNRKRAEVLRKRHPWARIELHHCDSRRQPIPDGVGDFTITSPPYYDIEYYGDEAAQLGKCPTYGEFLDGMQLVVNENFRTLKPGAFSCWFVNDFRKDGVMHFYHDDVIDLGTRAGFEPWDLLVVDLGRCLRDCFPNQSFRSKIIPKRHEYCVVFRKPK